MCWFNTETRVKSVTVLPAYLVLMSDVENKNSEDLCIFIS